MSNSARSHSYELAKRFMAAAKDYADESKIGDTLLADVIRDAMRLALGNVIQVQQNKSAQGE